MTPGCLGSIRTCFGTPVATTWPTRPLTCASCRTISAIEIPTYGHLHTGCWQSLRRTVEINGGDQAPWRGPDAQHARRGLYLGACGESPRGKVKPAPRRLTGY